MPPEESQSFRNPTLRDLLAVAALASAFFGVSVYVDLFEWLVKFPIHHPNWHIPEISGAFVFASIGLVIVAIRRWRDLNTANADLVQVCSELEREKSEIEVLNEIADLIQSCLSSKESRRIIERLGRKAFPHHAGGVYLLRNSRNILESGGEWNHEDAGARENSFPPNDCWALRRGLPHLSGEGTGGLRCSHLEESFRGWSFCVPLAAMGETIGVLHIRAGRTDGGPAGLRELAQPARDENFAVRFAATAATALANLQLRETLRYQSVRDPLTGLYNRRYLEDLLSVEVGRSVRKLRPLGLIMLDVDHFKKYNDTHGHEAGDNVLRSLAAALAKAVRKEDIVCRFGGEEFVIVMPEAPRGIALSRAERMRTEVHRMKVSQDGRSLGPITFSAGVACFPDHGATADSLIAAADAALYRAKAQGRDCVIPADPPELAKRLSGDSTPAGPDEPAQIKVQ